MLSVQFTSAAQSCPTLSDPMGHRTPGYLFTINSWSWLKLMSIEFVMSFNHLILCHPLLLLSSIFPSIRVFSRESVFHMRRPKHWSFRFSITPSNEYPGLISLGLTGLISLSEVKPLSRAWLFATPWTVAYKAPLSMEFSRQEYWSGLPFPSPGDLSDLGIEPRSPALWADALPSEPTGKPLST